MSADILTDTNKNSSSLYEDDNHYLNIDTQIGKGSFAKVYKGYYHTVNNNDSKQLVAIKVIDSSLLNSSNKKQQQILTNNLEIEITILKKLIHKNIVKLITTIVVNETKQFIIVMEYCNLGDLSMLIRINKNINNYKTNSSTLKFIRSKNLIHRDIKPQNLLLSTANSDTTPPILKVADFGFARFLPSQSMAETLCGSPQWMAPEILSYKKYDEKVDLWSSGAVIYEMCFG
ncbi:kinase-like protein, partial [Hanseniaspora valbyensis NRRL Y-1626]